MSDDLMPLLQQPCRGCGFDSSLLSVTRIIEMFQRMPARFANRIDKNERTAALAGEAQVHGWTVLEHVAHVRGELHVKANRLDRLLSEDWPVIDPGGIDRLSAAPTAPNIPAVLAEIALCCDRLARMVSGMTVVDRSRPGRRLDQTVTAWDLVLESTHEGLHHLTVIEESEYPC